MTWTRVADQSSDFEHPADAVNGYVQLAYVQNDYIAAEGLWSVMADVSTVWA